MADDANVVWSGVAAAWERNAELVERTKAPLTSRILELIALREGERVLELGAGPGLLGRRLAEIVGPNGRTVVSDVADGMVGAAGRRLAGVPGVQVARLDASATGLPDASQDAVVFRMGLMFVTEPTTAISEIHRVLGAGGRTAVAVWAAPEHNPWLTSVGMSAMIHGLVAGGPPVGPGGLFSLADPGDVERTFKAGGFDIATVETIDLEMRFDSFDAYFAHVSSMAGPLAEALGTAGVEQTAAVRTTTREFTARFVTGGGEVALPARANLAFARK